MKNLMLDLEVLGKNSQAPIASIGCVFFEPSTGELGPRFYTVVNLDSALEAGGVPDGSTITWWLRQSAAARAAIVTDDAVSISDALLALTTFVSRNCELPKYLKVWGNGAAFDNSILRSAYESCGMAPFWNWFNDLDVRTIVNLGRQVGFDPKRDMPFEGEPHHALADAIHQAKYVSAIHQHLLAPHLKDSEQ